MVTVPVVGKTAQLTDRELRQTTTGKTIIDAVFYRPVGLIAIPAGAVLFILTLPFSATGSNVGESWGNLVVSPARYTFARPLGDI